MKQKKILIIGSDDKYSLESSYQRAAVKLGLETKIFPIYKVLAQKSLIPYLAKKINANWPNKVWTEKANRELVPPLSTLSMAARWPSLSEPVYTIIASAKDATIANEN